MRPGIAISIFMLWMTTAEAAWNGCTISQKLDVAIIYDASESMANGASLDKIKAYMSEIVKIFNIQTRDLRYGLRVGVWGYTFNPITQFDFESCLSVEHALKAIGRIRPMGKTGVMVPKMFEFAANGVFNAKFGARGDATVTKVAILIIDSEILPYSKTASQLKAALQAKNIATFAVAIEDSGLKATKITPYLPIIRSPALPVASKAALSSFTGLRTALKSQFTCSKCFPTPCQNSGTCLDKPTPPFYECECISGWVGPNCQAQDPCQVCRSNGGTCIPGGSSYTCMCNDDKIGEYCHLPNPCHPAPGPCKNGSSCKPNVKVVKDYSCKCVGNFTGKNCDQKPTVPCSSNQCGGYKCIPLQGTHVCVCPQNCRAKPDCSVCTKTTPCNPNPCLNGCRCQESKRHEGGFFCSGSKGNLGRLCDMSSADITCGPAYIEVKIPESIVKAYESGVKGAVAYFSPKSKNSYNCLATYDATQKKYLLKIPTPFDGCGTARTAVAGGYQYRNNVWLNRQSTLIDMPVPVVQFICTYGGSQAVVSTAIQPVLPATNTVPVVTNSGKFRVSMNAYKKAPGVKDRELITSGSIYTVGQQVYLSARLVAPNQPTSGALVLKIIDCYATTAPNSLAGKLDLVKQGCPEKSIGVTIHGATLNSSATIGFRTFQLQNSQYVYYTCKVDVCNVLEPTCRPATNCTTGRRRRGADSGNPRGEEKKNLVHVGPLIILTEHQKQKILESFANPDQPVYISGQLIALDEKDITPGTPPLQPDTVSQDLQLVLVSLANFVVLVLFSIVALCLFVTRRKRQPSS